MIMDSEIIHEDLDRLTQYIYDNHYYDFRNYAKASLGRRIALAMQKFGYGSLIALEHGLKTNKSLFGEILQYLTVSTTEMFRDPEFFKSFRDTIVPLLSTYPSINIWIAGCSTGEEVYSYLIILKEEGLLDRCHIYATDINTINLAKAKKGILDLIHIKKYTENYYLAGGRESFSKYYQTGRRAALFDQSLIDKVTFAEHCLATDGVFSELHFISCRNVLIYFERSLQNKAVGLFFNSLVGRGYLGLGSRETLKFNEFFDFFRPCAQGNFLQRDISSKNLRSKPWL